MTGTLDRIARRKVGEALNRILRHPPKTVRKPGPAIVNLFEGIATLYLRQRCQFKWIEGRLAKEIEHEVNTIRATGRDDDFFTACLMGAMTKGLHLAEEKHLLAVPQDDAQIPERRPSRRQGAGQPGRKKDPRKIKIMELLREKNLTDMQVAQEMDKLASRQQDLRPPRIKGTQFRLWSEYLHDDLTRDPLHSYISPLRPKGHDLAN